MIFVSDKAKDKVKHLMQEAAIADAPEFFVRVSVVGGGCSGLSYKLDFDNEQKPMDQVFEDNGVKVVTDLKSFLYLVHPHSKRNGCNDDRNFPVHEFLLDRAPISVLQSCMVRFTRKALFPYLE